MNIKYLRNEFAEYITQTTQANIWGRIPHHWIDMYDHITYQVSDPRRLETAVRELEPSAHQITCIEQDGPFEVAIKLAGPLVVSQAIRVDWVKLKEIDKAASGQQREGVSALNILVGSVDTLKSRLAQATNLDAEEVDGALQVKVNGRGQTVNFIQTALAVTTEQLLEEHYAVPILPKRVSEPDSVRSHES